MNKQEPKPLDLEGIKKKVLDEFERLEDLKKIEYEKLTHSEKWDYFANLIKKHRSGETNLFTSSYERIIKLTTEEIRQRIKSACEFYLRYKDRPDLLTKEHSKYSQKLILNFNTLCQNCRGELGEVCIKTWVGWDDGDYEYFCSEGCSEKYKRHLPKTENEHVSTYDKYNEWLFKLAFKEVLKNEKD